MATFNFRSREAREFKLAERGRTRPLPLRDESMPPQQQQALDDTDLEDDGWLVSSYELRRGLQVSEEPIDTLPAELRDAFPRRR